MKKLFLAILAVGVIAGSYYLSLGYFAEEEEEGFGGPHGRTIPVETTAVVRQSMIETITYPGSVAADEVVSIAPRVSGRIKAINVDFGDHVNEGDPLIELDDAEFVERLKQAQANLRLSQARLNKGQTQLDLAGREYDRVQALVKQGMGMAREVDAAEANRDSAKADVEVARAELARIRAALEEAQLNLADTRISSTLTGWVQARHADPGTLSSPSSPILTIVDTDPALIIVYIPEREMKIAAKGRSATVLLANGIDSYEGVVARVAPSLSMSTRTTEVIIEVPNPDQHLRPGMSTDVTLVSRKAEDALVIPSKALIFQEGRPAVYLVEDGVAYITSIRTGIEQDGLIEIVSGLEVGDRIVSVGQYLLKDRQAVRDDLNEGDGAHSRPLDT